LFKQTIGNNSPLYAAGYNNCTSAVVYALQKALGGELPHTQRNQWPIGAIEYNPADLGEDLRLDPIGGQFESWPTHQNSPPLTDCK
jgi:hypothetical protein